jgi:hypothetical protein
MKRKKLIAFALYFVPFVSFAQHRLFVEGGLTQSELSLPSGMIGSPSTAPRTAGYALAGVRTHLVSRISLENAVGYLSRKYYYHYFVGPDYSGDGNYSVQSLYAHSVADLKLSLNKRFSINPGAGFYAALNTSGTLDRTDVTIAGPQHVNRDLVFGNGNTDDMRKGEVGALVRLRIQFGGFHLQAGYHFGLNDMRQGSAKETWKTWLIGAGISLHTN